ncbi:hypothetical protein [Acidipila sp. EB88]|uniref:hypothetical protein n=1 Tax=Acidipila sp. EB88 TaxID=2305226 RepID=UPI000F5F616D|nr:hypothetical protein [Acidipila sp. EB88]RRA48552.1 hypothetical protein D1Y84_09880 [Acidipila sp. EB88]
MRWSRRRSVLLGALLLAAVVVCLFLWRQSTAPLVARVLPESEGILYFNLSPLRAATHFDRRPVEHDPGYQRFIDATGINFERDLNEAAFALDHLPDSTGPNGGLAFSEVFAGTFDAARLSNYLSGIATSTESYDGKTIFNVPSESRTVRVVVLNHSMVAISNTPTTEQIHSILDRARGAWLPFNSAGPTLLSEHYRDLPVLSLAWGLGQIGLPLEDHGVLSLFGVTLPFRLDATFIASLRWTGALRLRIEEVAPNAASARASAKALSGLLAVGRIAENNLPGRLSNADTQALLNSATITQHDDRAILAATLPENLLHSLMRTPDGLATGTSKP